jgi:predicted nucleic acid-binding protein
MTYFDPRPCIRRSGSPGHSAGRRQQYAQPFPVIDALIAATARVHGLTLVTRNIKDFDLAGAVIKTPVCLTEDQSFVARQRNI